jgi:hypothetical protein
VTIFLRLPPRSVHRRSGGYVGGLADPAAARLGWGGLGERLPGRASGTSVDQAQGRVLRAVEHPLVAAQQVLEGVGI